MVAQGRRLSNALGVALPRPCPTVPVLGELGVRKWFADTC
jgi:hypothetical protein